ncbi:MAG TPA: transposase [Pirellulaceae bacterium]|jgi:putative transposase|nr:transposase [Pirellulaceae bacterium]
MSRDRRSYDGTTFFFTVVTSERRRFLCTDFARSALRGAFREVRENRLFEIVAFVLLPDHLHTVWQLPPGDRDYSTRWSAIKASFTRAWNAAPMPVFGAPASRSGKRERGLWQRRFFEQTVRDERDLRRCVDYVHVNPLKHGLAGRVADWPWSSFHRYVRLGKYAPDWGSSNEWYGDEFANYE